jgi:molybdenum-dependent DNA-binding transcriptional regulator ModE
MSRLRLYLVFDDEGRLEPYKVALLECLSREGSISAAARPH